MVSLNDRETDTAQAALQRVVCCFEQLQLSDVERLESLEAPRFVITQKVLQGTHAFVTWDFLFAMPRMNNGSTQTIRGSTHFVLREEDDVWRVAMHRDYWDTAEELYEKLPVLGSLMRWLKKRANS